MDTQTGRQTNTLIYTHTQIHRHTRADTDTLQPFITFLQMDGEWEAPLVENPRCKEAPGCGPWSPPLIDNPEYKGIWRPALIENPQYKGIWKPRKIKNPEYFEEVIVHWRSREF